MVLELSVKSNVAEFERGLNNFQRKQLPFATAKALTMTAKHGKEVARREMRRVFDRPKPFTLNSTAVRPAKKNDLVAEVFFREFAGKGIAAGKYLKAEVHGGPRRAKRSELLLRGAGIMRADEFLVPARGMPLDAFGNMPPRVMNKILSQLRAQRDPSQNETRRSGRRRRKKSSGGNFFVGGSGQGSALPRGIYERFGARAIRMVFAFVRQPRYRAVFPFESIWIRSATRRFPLEFNRAFAQAIRTAR